MLSVSSCATHPGKGGKERTNYAMSTTILPTTITPRQVFTCPVSKEGATPDNPPMMLPCGHVLALSSITKLARGSRTHRFKCPYCPAECSTAMAKQLLL